MKNTDKKLALSDVALEVMKIFVESQAKHRRMTLLNKIKYFLGMNGWKADFDLNFYDIAKKSFMMAEEMLKREETIQKINSCTEE